ncbi:unnamed protein product, partial [Hapterophycus canaliculatus]
VKAIRSAALAGPALPIGVIDWPGVASSLWRRHSVAWSPQLCQGLWKFVAYGDVSAAMSALPRAGETLNGAWTRQDLLYDSDTEALSVNPLCISKKDTTSKNPRWGRSRTNPAKKREWSLAEKARSEEPLRRAPRLISGSIGLRHSPERPDAAVGKQITGRASDEDQLVPLCTLAALPTFVRSRKRPLNGTARPREPPSPKSARAAAEVLEAEARVLEERQGMQLLLEQSAADSSAANKQNSKANPTSGNARAPKAPAVGQVGGGGGAEGPRLPKKKQRKKSGSVERAVNEAAKRAEIWAAAGDAAVAAAAAAAAAAATGGSGAPPSATAAWPGHRPPIAGPAVGLPSVPQSEWRGQGE